MADRVKKMILDILEVTEYDNAYGNMYVVMFQGAKRNQCETQKNTLEKSTE